METYRFYKEHDGRWYVDLPDYPGPKEDLEMVAGADQMLNIYAQDQFEVSLTIDTVFFEGAQDVLYFDCLAMGDNDGGAYYTTSTIKGLVFVFEIWLCPVMLYVFGEYPEKLYVVYSN